MNLNYVQYEHQTGKSHLYIILLNTKINVIPNSKINGK